jgi:hypothetical protein
MKALLIPADSSRPVTEIEFDRDKLWRYVVTRCDPPLPPWLANQVAVLTKDNAQGDYLLRNSRASQYVQDNLAAKDRTDGLDVPEELCGDVIVLSWDTAFETVTDVQERLRSEYFEDVLTQIVSLGREDAFTQILRLGPENLDEARDPNEPGEGVVRTYGVWDDLGELDDEGDPTQHNRAVGVRALSMDPNHAKAVIEEYEAKRYLEAESDRHPNRPERRRASR